MDQIQLDKTQQRVFDFMTENKSITSIQACTELGETRLSARIFELKAKGINISYEWVDVTNRYNEKRRIKKYFIA